jgi:hypothetical protein
MSDYKISLIKNNAPEIEKIAFKCDGEICPSLNQYPMIRDQLNMYNTTCIIGRQGSGKTNLLINFIKKIYRKKFHKIYVFMPASSRASIKNNIFEKLPPEQLYEELTFEALANLHEVIKKNKHAGEKSLIIFDDCQRALKELDILKKLQEMIANQRHLSLVNLIICQNFFMLDRKLREILNNVIFFKLDKSQTEKLFKDVIEHSHDKFEAIRDMVFDEPYNWMLISKRNQKMYKMFDEIVINEDEDDLEAKRLKNIKT